MQHAQHTSLERAYATSVFHEGEQAVQQRVGVREQVEALGPRMVRDHMPEQHRAFFTQLPFVLAGTVDTQGQPWASVLAATPGFVTSPDPYHLHIHAHPLPHDPLNQTLVAGAAIGLLGIEPHTRRRNRMNGIVDTLDRRGFSVEVGQSFGNCPKYIQARKPEYTGDGARQAQVHDAISLDAAAMRMVRAADTFYIATAFAPRDGVPTRGDAMASPAQGADISHRGGRPGFVRVDEDGTLTAPDFTGNFLFNTLGNIAINPRAGLLFIDFDSGDLLYLAVTAQIVWDGPEVAAFEGAERLLRFRVTHMRRVEAGLPLRWSAAQLSPALQGTGQWPATGGAIPVDSRS